MTTTQIYKMSISYLLNPEPEETSRVIDKNIRSDLLSHIYSNNMENLNPDILKIIRQHLPVKNTEKKLYGEVFTPLELVCDMLDLLPKEVWSNPNLKWLDPANGIGNFPVVVYYRLMEGLQLVIPDKQNRSKHIIEYMLYMVELNPKNCVVCKEIFSIIDNTAEPNIIEANFLEWVSPIKFDIIMGNPPYQTNLKRLGIKSYSIWESFFEKSYDLLNENTHLLLIHPSSWRAPSGIRRNIFNKIIKNDLVYLNMCSYKDVSKYFKRVSTNCDYYYLKKTLTNTNTTIVNDIDNNEYKINLNNYPFIPSGKYDIFDKLIEKDTDINLLYSCIYHIQHRYKHMSKTKTPTEVIYQRSMYGHDKSWVEKNQTQIYNLPCVYTISKTNEIKFWYSSVDKGMFGIPKVIWANGAGNPILDLKGEYGMTEFAYAIADDPEVLPSIKKAMESENFINLMRYCAFEQNHKYNYKVIKTFKKDFWKEFI